MRIKLQRLLRSDWFFAGSVAVLYCALNAVLLCWHEPWRDEAQAWLLSRDLDFFGLLRWASVDGHPVLWWTVLSPFSKLGLPYRTIGAVSLLLMTAAVLLFLRYAPLPKLLRAVFVFSPCCVYWYPVISRCYALIPLALVLTAMSYKKRNERPVLYALSLFLLSETHIVMEGLVGMLMLFFAFEQLARVKKRAVKPARALLSIGVCVLAVAALYFQLAGSIHENTAYGAQSGTLLTHGAGLLKKLLTILRSLFGLNAWPGSAYLAAFLAALCAVGVLFWARFAPKPALTFLFGVAYQLAVYEFIYPAITMQRVLTVAYLFAFCLVQTQLDRGARGLPAALSFRRDAEPRWRIFSFCTAAALLLLFLLPLPSFWPGLLHTRTELYSASGAAASCIETELPENALVIGDCEYTASAVAAYFPRDTKFYNPRRHNGEMFSTWSEESRLPLNLDAAMDELSALPGAKDRPWYLLVSADYGNGACHVDGGVEPYVARGTLTYLASFYAAEDQIADESYDLYRINP